MSRAACLLNPQAFETSAQVLSRRFRSVIHSDGEGRSTWISGPCLFGHSEPNGVLDGGKAVSIGDLLAIGSTDVEGVDHGGPEGVDLGRITSRPHSNSAWVIRWS